MGSYQQTWAYNDGGYSGPPPGASGPPLYNMDPERKIEQAQYVRRTRVKGMGLPAIFAIVFAIVVIAGASVYLFAFDGINQLGDFFQPPTAAPTFSPTTTAQFSLSPTDAPTREPTNAPTRIPTNQPTPLPTSPTTTNQPTTAPITPFIVVTFNIGPTVSPSIATTAQNAFTAAADKWTRVLGNTVLSPRNVNPTTFGGLSSSCALDSGADPVFPAAVANQVHIVAEIAFDDGPGGTLGFAGPCALSTRITSALPADKFIFMAGIMSFDSADIQGLIDDNELEDVILHEMGHVLGIGTLWDFSPFGNNLLINPIFGDPNNPQPNNDPQFIGTNAVFEHGQLGETGNIPVEDGTFQGLSNAQILAGQGQGSIDGHWRETVFQTELMTPAIGGNNNPMSRMTLASLEDLGYTVDYNEADAYSVPRISSEDGPVLSRSSDSGHQHVLLNDIFRAPGLLEEIRELTEKADRARRRLGGNA